MEPEAIENVVETVVATITPEQVEQIIEQLQIMNETLSGLTGIVAAFVFIFSIF